MRHRMDEFFCRKWRGERVIATRFANFPSRRGEREWERERARKMKRRVDNKPSTKFLLWNQRREPGTSEGQIPWQRHDTSETRNTSTIPLISLATVRHLVKRIEIFQEQIVSMCGRAEYGGGLGTVQSDAWNVIVGLTKNARTPDKDVVTIEIVLLSLLSIPLSRVSPHVSIKMRDTPSLAGLAVNTLTDRSSQRIL